MKKKSAEGRRLRNKKFKWWVVVNNVAEIQPCQLRLKTYFMVLRLHKQWA